MEIRTFWTIILKSIGLWLLLNCFYIIPQFFSSLSFIEGQLDSQALVLQYLMTSFTIIVYILLVRLFLFKNTFIINFLKLEKHFTQERFDVNISYQSLLIAVVIIIGGLIFLQSLPVLFEEILSLMQNKKSTMEVSDTPWVIYHFVRTIIGLILMTNSRPIVRFIEKQQ